MNDRSDQHFRSTSNDLLGRWLTGGLIFLVGQTLSVQIFGCFGALSWCWVAYIGMLVILFTWGVFAWKNSDFDGREAIKSPWSWWMPWVVIVGCIVQITLYSSGMNDSLSYRIPRIYLWLQEGRICKADTADLRINTMTTGWENLAIPLYSLNLPRLCRLINLSMWGVMYTLIHNIARLQGVDEKRSRWIAMALASAPCFVMQAPSTANDLFVCGLVLIALYFIYRHSSKPEPTSVIMSLLAVVLAANVKPQFLLLGLGWAGWWLFGVNQPWRQVKIVQWIVLAPLLFMISPAWKLIDNFAASGSLMGVVDKTMRVTQPLWLAAVANSIQFMITQLQLPILPSAGKLDAAILSLPVFQYLHGLMPRFGPGLTDVPLIDNASYGFIHYSVIIVGCLLGWKRSSRFSRVVFCVGVVIFLIAATQVSVSTLGRSFIGYTIFAFPLAISGLSGLTRDWILKFCAFAGLFVLVNNPSHPLWPCSFAEREVRKFSIHYADKLASYNLYRERAKTGVGILEDVPYGESVSVLVREVTPIKNLWNPDWRAHRINFVHNVGANEFEKTQVRWLLIADKAKEQFPDLSEDYRRLMERWKVVKQMTYYPNIKQGAEVWTLYRRPE